MGLLVKHILCLFCLMTVIPPAMSQENKDIDSELNRYETLCKICLELKTRIKDGENIEKNEAQALINSFVNMNRQIKTQREQMSESQLTRFDAINKWFSSGERPKILDAQNKIASISPSPKTIAKTTNKITIIPYKRVPAETKEHSLIRKTPLQTHILASMAAPDMAYGIMAGVHRKWGGYVAFRSNFIFGGNDYSCTSDGKISNGDAFWSNGITRNRNLSLSGGAMYSINKWATIFGGLGYGYRQRDWQDINGNWVNVSDWSYNGVAAEAGAIFSIKMLSISVGISTIKFRTATLTCGVGVRF